MKITLSARLVESATPKPALLEFIELARACGYDGIGIRSGQLPPELGAPAVAAVRQALDRAGMLAFSITCELKDVPRLVPLARALGVKVIQAGGTPVEMAQAAALLDADMRLGPQMHTGGEYETVASAAQVLAAIPDRRIGVVVEPANLMLAGLRWSADLLRPLAGRIVGCNLQSLEVGVGSQQLKLRDGTARLYRRVGLGENRQIDIPGFVRALAAAGYTGPINVLEPAREGLTSRQVAAEALAVLRRCPEYEGAKSAPRA